MEDKNELYHSDSYLGETYNDGLYHYKYVYKKRINGKWRYFYKNDNAVYEKVKGNPNSKYGTYLHMGPNSTRVGHVVKSNKLFSKTTTSTMKPPGKDRAGATDVITTTREVGKIEQGVDAVKKALGKFGKQTIKTTNKAVNKGKKTLSRLWKKLKNR